MTKETVRSKARFAMNRAFFCLFLCGPGILPAVAQPSIPECKPVSDIHEFVKVWNDAVIGPGSRSHACTLGLLTADARITGVVTDKNGKAQRVIETPQEFVGWYRQHPTETFWERTLHSTLDIYENVARVTRTYEVRAKADGPVEATGIEDFELIFDGKEWRVFTLLWQDAVPGKPLPSRYLASGK